MSANSGPESFSATLTTPDDSSLSWICSKCGDEVKVVSASTGKFLCAVCCLEAE